MPSVADHQKPRSALRQAFASLYRMAASLKLAVLLIVVLGGVLVWATLLEAEKGREFAQWYVYRSHWFMTLLALLGINILAATLIRFPWRMRQIGFVVTHAGLLVLLLGAAQTFLAGIDGQIGFAEGESADSILLLDQSQIEIVSQSAGTRRVTDFNFVPGPVDWDKPLSFPEAQGVQLKVLKFYRHAREEENWLPDETGQRGPAVQLAVSDAKGQSVGKFWIWGNPFGTKPTENQPAFQLLEAPVASMVDDFLNPVDKAESEGVLSVHYDGKVYPVPVKQNVGKKVPIGESGVSVEIAEYFANAAAGGGGQFTSAGAVPKNPLLRLKVYLPDEKEPIPEIAFARSPLVNYALMRGQSCPVRFWYRHPGMPASDGAEFLQTPDGKLYCRVGADGHTTYHGEIKKGDRISLGDGFEATIAEHLPHARQEITYYSVDPARGAKGPDAAALVELSVDDSSRQFWLRRGDSQANAVRLDTPDSSLMLSFGYRRLPLGFSLKLNDFQMGMNPGGMGAASFASDVQLVDPAKEVDREQKISMNSPLVHGKYTFYQSSYDDLGGGRWASYLSVAYDPGRFSKYLGSIMVCVGILLMFYLKYFLPQKKKPAPSPA